MTYAHQSQVAIAILYQEGRFLMQLRDNIPGIVYPGCWGFFGGHIEPGETPKVALERELQEEINFATTHLEAFDCYSDEKVVRHVFHGPLTVPVEALVLNEGWDLALLTPEIIRQGHHYSVQADQVRPLGSVHQGILLDFLTSPTWHRSAVIK